MKALDLNTIKDIAEATDTNSHTHAIITLAYALGNVSMVAELVEIDLCHELEGHMTQDLFNDRKDISKIIMAQAKATYSNYDEIYAAYSYGRII